MSDTLEVAKTTMKLSKEDRELIKEIKKRYNALHGLLLKGTVLVYEMGELLWQKKKSTYSLNEYKYWIDKNLDMTYGTAENYRKVYEHFYEHPELLEKLSILEAYAEAGIRVGKKQLEAPKENGRIYTAGLEDGVNDNDYMTVFDKRTLSGVNLQNYRVEVYGTEVWGFRKGFGRFPIADLRVVKPKGLPDIEWQQLTDDVVSACEHFYAKIEAYEDNGKITAPVIDERFRRD